MTLMRNHRSAWFAQTPHTQSIGLTRESLLDGALPAQQNFEVRTGEKIEQPQGLKEGLLLCKRVKAKQVESKTQV